MKKGKRGNKRNRGVARGRTSDVAAPGGSPRGEKMGGGPNEYFKQKNFVVCAQYIVKLLNKIRGYSINNRDFFKLMIYASGSHCNYRMPSNATEEKIN